REKGSDRLGGVCLVLVANEGAREGAQSDGASCRNQPHRGKAQGGTQRSAKREATEDEAGRAALVAVRRGAASASDVHQSPRSVPAAVGQPTSPAHGRRQTPHVFPSQPMVVLLPSTITGTSLTPFESFNISSRSLGLALTFLYSTE